MKSGVLQFIYITCKPLIPDPIAFPLNFSALNCIPFLPTLIRFMPKPDGYSGFFQRNLDYLNEADGPLGRVLGLATLERTLAIVLVFFFFLGLRNRFRLG